MTTRDRAQAAAPTEGAGRIELVVLLAAVFVCAACGLVYELALVALGSYLLGSSITQTSLVIAAWMFAMGIGALLAKPLVRRPLLAFGVVELALALVGGFSIPVLYFAFAWLHVYTPAMLVVALLVGMLIGAEIPLLMELLQRLRPRRASRAVADLTALDYVGALVGGLAFPFLLLPVFGLLVGTIVTAGLNIVAAWLVTITVARRMHPRGAARRRTFLRATAACGVAAAVLATMAVRATAFELSTQQLLYRDPIVLTERSDYQDIVVTRGNPFGPAYDDLRLFLDGDLQFSSLDEYRYHEMLVHPALNGPRSRVLILGGGDGLALREVLAYDDVEEVTLVDLDDRVVDVARTYEPIRSLNEGAFEDERVTVRAEDAFVWARRGGDGQAYDAIVADFPDPDSTATAKLYSKEMYALLERLLAPRGRLVVQAGSPFFAPRAFWSVEATVAAAGLETRAYHADVPSFGDWGWVLAGRERPELAVAPDAPARRFASPDVVRAAGVFPPDRRRPDDVEVSTLLDPTILEDSSGGWVGY